MMLPIICWQSLILIKFKIIIVYKTHKIMAEEQQEQSTGGSIKNILIGLVSTITLGIGGWFTTKLNGGDEKEAPAAAAPVINITNSNQQQQAAGKTVIINKGGGTAQPAAAVPKPKEKKKDGDEFKEEAPKW